MDVWVGGPTRTISNKSSDANEWFSSWRGCISDMIGCAAWGETRGAGCQLRSHRALRPRLAWRGATAGLVLTLVVVPVLVNLASDSLPESWQPYRGYSWLLLAVVLVAAVLHKIARGGNGHEVTSDDLGGFVGASPPAAPHFIGRPTAISSIRKRLLDEGRVTVIGLPGAGKTQAVAAYARAHSGDYDLVWWVRAQDPSLVTLDLAAVPEAASHTGQPSPVSQRLRSHGRWLVVFDDTSVESDVPRLIPDLPGGHVIIISRERLAVTTAVIEIGDWTAREADAFLARALVAPPLVRKQLASTLGYVPIALSQAANYINLCQITAGDYLTLFEKRARDLLDMSGSTRAASIAAGFAMAIHAADREARGAGKLAEICAVCADGPIPRDLPAAYGRIEARTIRWFRSPVDARFRARLRDPLAYNAMLAALTRHLVVAPSARNVRMHPLVAKTVRDRLGAGRTRRVVFSAATAWLQVCGERDAWRRRVDDDVWESLVPQVLRLGELAQEMRPPLTSWSSFGVRVAWYCWRDVALLLDLASRRLAEQGDREQGERVARLALELASRSSRPTQVFHGLGAPGSWVPMVNSLEACGEFAAERGDLAEAERLFTKGLGIAEARHGPLHRASLVANLAWVRRALGDPESARELLEREWQVLRHLVPEGCSERMEIEEMLEA